MLFWQLIDEDAPSEEGKDSDTDIWVETALQWEPGEGNPPQFYQMPPKKAVLLASLSIIYQAIKWDDSTR